MTHALPWQTPARNYYPLPKVLCRLGLSPGEIAVYSFLMYCENRTTYQCYPSYRTIGEAVGMAFQIQDDILDYTPTAHTGKPANNDLREGKITLPLLSVLDRASDSRRRELLERLSRCHESDEEVEYLRSTVENEGGLSFAAEVMQGYIARAVEMLSDYPDSEYRSALVNLCAYIAERDR